MEIIRSQKSNSIIIQDSELMIRLDAFVPALITRAQWLEDLGPESDGLLKSIIFNQLSNGHKKNDLINYNYMNI